MTRIRKILIIGMILGMSVWSSIGRAESTIQEFWVCPSPTGMYVVEQTQAEGQAVVRIGFRGSQGLTWESAVGRVISASTLGQDLYLVFDNGLIVRQSAGTEQFIFPRLSNGAVPVQLATDSNQNCLYVLGNQDHFSTSGTTTQPVLRSVWGVFKFEAGQWKAFSSLPAELEFSSRPVLTVEKGQVHLFVRAGAESGRILHWSYDGGKWVMHPKIELPEPFIQFYPISIQNISAVVTVAASQSGEQLKLYHILPAGKVKAIGVLKASEKSAVIKSPYALFVEPDRAIGAARLSADNKDVQLFRWSVQGDPIGAGEMFSPPKKDANRHSSIWTILLMVGLLMIVLMRGTSTSFGVEIPSSLMVSDYWRRGVAFVIDMIPIMFLSTFFLQDYARSIQEQGTLLDILQRGQTPDPRLYTIGFFIMFGYAAYCILMEGLVGWTVGKRAMGLEVRQIRKINDRPVWKQIVIRNITKILELYFLPFLLILFLTRYRQRIGDVLAGTIVIQPSGRTTGEDRNA